MLVSSHAFRKPKAALQAMPGAAFHCVALLDKLDVSFVSVPIFWCKRRCDHTLLQNLIEEAFCRCWEHRNSLEKYLGNYWVLTKPFHCLNRRCGWLWLESLTGVITSCIPEIFINFRTFRHAESIMEVTLTEEELTKEGWECLTCKGHLIFIDYSFKVGQENIICNILGVWGGLLKKKEEETV